MKLGKDVNWEEDNWFNYYLSIMVMFPPLILFCPIVYVAYCIKTSGSFNPSNWDWLCSCCCAPNPCCNCSFCNCCNCCCECCTCCTGRDSDQAVRHVNLLENREEFEMGEVFVLLKDY